MTALQLTVAKILECAEHYDWQLQGFGMLRLYLSKETRLHVWSTGHVVKNVSVIHDHPWDFESLVLCGAIRDITYDVESGSTKADTHHEQRILCGPGGGIVGEKCGGKTDVRLIPRSDRVIKTGSSYSRCWDTLHESRPEDGTVTLITRTFRADPDHARVFFPIGTEWLSAEPRAATRDEVLAITRVALNRMHTERTA